MEAIVVVSVSTVITPLVSGVIVSSGLLVTRVVLTGLLVAAVKPPLDNSPESVSLFVSIGLQKYNRQSYHSTSTLVELTMTAKILAGVLTAAAALSNR